MIALAAGIAVAGTAALWAADKDYTQYVNTLQGTDSHFGLSHGNTYPTVGMPFGLHFLVAVRRVRTATVSNILIPPMPSAGSPRLTSAVRG